MIPSAPLQNYTKLTALCPSSDRSQLAIATIGRRWRNGHSVASRIWCLNRHGFGQCLSLVEVEARENPWWLAATTNSLTPHQEAGYTSAVVNFESALPNPLQSGASLNV